MGLDRLLRIEAQMSEPRFFRCSASWVRSTALRVVFTSNQNEKRAEIRASGIDAPFPAGWFEKVTISSVDSPDAAARSRSSNERSIRSNTATIDEVTRFSPCR